jgi:hypothetical protein
MARFNDKYSLSPRIGIVDVTAMSFLCVFVFGVFSLSSIELLYVKQIELL